MRINNIPLSATRYILCAYLIVLSISPAFALGEGARNLLLIAFMGVAPVLLVIYPVWSRLDALLLLLSITTIIFPLLGHPETMRWSTVLYSCMFFMCFMITTRLLVVSNIDIGRYSNLIKGLIFAYFGVLLIQQCCVLLGLPIFNVSNYDVTQPWKLNSLMSEPEHSGRMMALLMFSYLTMQDCIEGRKITFKESWRRDKPIWLAFLWSMLTMVSAGAYLFLFIVVLKYLNRRRLLPIICCIIVLVILGVLWDIKPIVRVYNIVAAFFTFDINEIYRADQSGALRFIPAIICWHEIDLSSLNGWFGAGVDYVETFLYRYLPGVNEGYTGGGAFQYALEFGVLNFIIYSSFTFYACYDKQNKSVSILFWTLSVLLGGINVQLTWATIVFLYCNKRFERQKLISTTSRI